MDSNSKVVSLRKNKISEEDLSSLSKEELIERIQKLEAHVVQLKNLLHPSKKEEKPGRKSKPFDHKKYGKRHVLLQVAYVGWDYAGFVVQEHTEKTIEAEILKALEKTCLIEARETSNYHRCGRTDKGVSSFGQVISIDIRSNLSGGKGVFIPEGHQPKFDTQDDKDEIPYPNILNRVLPPEIRAIAWAPVEQNFSSRFDCKQRTYHYYFPKSNLDIEAMRKAAQSLVGEHDFRNFCKMDVGNGVVKFTRKIFDIQIEQLDDKNSSYTMCRLKLLGQAFLWHQVRCIVAVLFLIGRGVEDVSIIQELLDVERNPCKPQYAMASELPLNLFTCSYDDACHWIYNEENLRIVMSDYQSLWVESNVKATMTREMLQEIETKAGFSIDSQVKNLSQGKETKTYIPLMKRQKCDSLEERIEHYAKRKRIEIVKDDTSDQA